MGRITSGIGALVLALASVAPADGELPVEYPIWPIKVIEKENNTITYRKTPEVNSDVVRIFPSTAFVRGVGVPFNTIGYAPTSELPPDKKPLEVYVEPINRYIFNANWKKWLEDDAKKQCGKCHPIINKNNPL